MESYGIDGKKQVTSAPGNSTRERFLAIGTYLGFHRESFFPTEIGYGFRMPEVLDPLSAYQEKLSIFSGLDHRGRNGHEGWKAWMTGKTGGSISVDQLIANAIGDKTRHASLQLTCGIPPGQARLSFTAEGIALPMIGRPSVFYNTLFGEGSDKERIAYLLDSNRSVLDGVFQEAKSLQKNISSHDSNKLEEYLGSIRDVEKKLQKQRLWLDKPVQKIDYKLPEFDPVAPALALECESIMYDLMALALESDTTRVMTFLIPGWSQVFTIGGRPLSAGYHGLSHHGNDPARIREYNMVGREHVSRLAKFVERIGSIKEPGGQSLLDSTTIVYGSGMGDSNTHDNSNLPMLVAGGGFHHGNHHKIESSKKSGTRLLGDLYLTLLQKFGVEIDAFAGASHNLNELLS